MHVVIATGYHMTKWFWDASWGLTENRSDLSSETPCYFEIVCERMELVSRIGDLCNLQIRKVDEYIFRLKIWPWMCVEWS